MITRYLRRGLAAGLLAGVLAGLFALLFGEPQLDWAVALEKQADSAHAPEEAAHQHRRGTTMVVEVSRGTQKLGLFFATGLSGSFVGGLFGMAFAFFRGRLTAKSDWSRSLSSQRPSSAERRCSPSSSTRPTPQE